MGRRYHYYVYVIEIIERRARTSHDFRKANPDYVARQAVRVTSA